MNGKIKPQISGNGEKEEAELYLLLFTILCLLAEAVGTIQCTIDTE